ncbi:MAG: YfhO family protein [Erysipelotrichaceae bacterium]|nr:YfhO family protein [Erysipelotrichaceae bacterium]
MKKSFRNLLKEYLPILGILSFLLALIFVPFLLERKAFVLGMDIRAQYRPFYTEFRNLIFSSLKSGVLPFWSWNIFFGSNFWASKVYYVFTDFFAYLSLFLDVHYYYLLMFQTACKLSVAVLAFYFYCRIRKFKYAVSLILSFAWGFSSWALNFAGQPVFLYFYCLLPFYFAMIELYFEGKRKYLFSVITGIMLLANYYLFYTLAIFTVVYYLYRYYEIHRCFKGLFKSALILIGYYLLGVVCTAVIIVPCALFIVNNSRVGAITADYFSWNDLKVYLELLIATFYPTNIYVNRAGIINGVNGFSSIYNTADYARWEILFWSGTVSALLCINGLFDQDKVRRKMNRVYYLFLLCLMLFPVFSSVMHGFSEATFRWSMFAIFFNLMISGYYLDDSKQINKNILLVTIGLVCVLLIIDLPLTSAVTGLVLADYYDQYLKMLIFLPVIILIGFGLYRNRLKLVIVLTVLELGFSAFMTFNDNSSLKEYDWDFVINSEYVLGSYDQLTSYLTDELGDTDFYRIYAPYMEVYWYSSLNMNLVYGFAGVSTYDSTYNYAADDLLLIADLGNANGWTWNITQPDIIDFASVKYALVTSADELPHDNFVYITDYNGIYLYENLNYRSVANTFSSLMTYDEYAQIADSSLINETILCHSADYDAIKSYVTSGVASSASAVQKAQNSLEFSIKSTDRSFVVTSIAYDAGWKVYVDDQMVDIYQVNGGFIGFGLDQAGEHTVKMYFVPAGFKTGVIITLAGIVSLIGVVLYEEKQIRKKHKAGLLTKSE